MWVDILTAVSLFLVFEGVLPFITPAGYKRSVRQLLALDDRYLRMFGLGSMLAGVTLLYFIR